MAIDQVLLGLIATTVTVAGVQIQRAVRRDAMLRTTSDVYDNFWRDARSDEFRTLICADVAYEQELEPVLTKRLADSPLTAAEYRHVESVDRFCAALSRAYLVMDALRRSESDFYGRLWAWANAARRKGGRSISVDWYAVLLAYWPEKIASRIEVAAYVKRFWPTLHRRIVADA